MYPFLWPKNTFRTNKKSFKWPLFLIWIHGSMAIWLDPDVDSFFGSRSTDPGNMIFLLNSWQIWRDFWKICQGLPKLWIFSYGVETFGPKSVIFGYFDNVTLIFEDGICKKMDFIQKLCPTLKTYNFWTSGRIFKLQKSKLVRISSPIHLNHLDPKCIYLDPDQPPKRSGYKKNVIEWSIPKMSYWLHYLYFNSKKHTIKLTNFDFF